MERVLYQVEACKGWVEVLEWGDLARKERVASEQEWALEGNASVPQVWDCSYSEELEFPATMRPVQNAVRR